MRHSYVHLFPSALWCEVEHKEKPQNLTQEGNQSNTNKTNPASQNRIGPPFRNSSSYGGTGLKSFKSAVSTTRLGRPPHVHRKTCGRSYQEERRPCTLLQVTSPLRTEKMPNNLRTNHVQAELNPSQRLRRPELTAALHRELA